MNIRTQKKGQLQSMETIIVVILLMLLVFFGLRFYATITQEELRTLEQERDIAFLETTLLEISNLPELSCPVGSIKSTICLDTLKLEILSSWLNASDPEYYSDEAYLRYVSLFGSIKMTVIQTYPASTMQSVVLFDAREEGDVFTRQLPISLYDPLTETTSLGLILLEVSS